MGLLSDPNYGSAKWVSLIMRLYYPICVVCFAAAIGWFVMLGNREFNNETYFSENALLPGLVTNEFNAEQSAKQYYNEFLQELEDKYSDTDEMPVPWLVAKMSQLHLEVYTHNFTLVSPLGSGQVFHGTNVYGILRANRASRLEALVVSAPYRAPRSHLKGTAAGVALMLSFAQFARPQKYWAKDIIFLITCHEQLGMQAWLEAYHGSTQLGTFRASMGAFWPNKDPGGEVGTLGRTKYLDPGTLKGRSGSIQAAINLEFHTPKIKYVEVKLAGLNGQLPNLDLANLLHKLCAKAGLPHSFKHSYSWMRSRYNADEWKDNLKTMLQMVITQMPGVPSGNHGLFHRFGIEAVTLEGREGDDPSGPAPRANTLQSANFYRLGAVLEGALRSLNNLLERFHQSYFFYLPAAVNRFVSIGQYMPCLCLLIGAMLIKSLALWVSVQQNPEEESNIKDKDKTCDTSKENETENREKKKKKVTFAVQEKDISRMSLMNLGVNLLLVHLCGYAVMQSPVFFSYYGTHYGLKPEMSVLYGLATSCLLIAISSPLAIRYLRTGPLNYEELALLNVLVLVELATLCLCVGMHNFSLGLCLGVVYTPLALVAGVTKKEGVLSTCKAVTSRIVCSLSHPLVLLLLSCSLFSFSSLPEEGVKGAFMRGKGAAANILVHSYVDYMVFGNWLFGMATSLLLPVWTVLWQLACTRVAQEDR